MFSILTILAFIVALTSIVSQTTVINNTCTVNDDIPRTVIQTLPYFLDVYTSSVVQAAQLQKNGVFNFTENPLLADSVLRNYFWSYWKSTGTFLYVGLQSGYFLSYRITTGNTFVNLLYCPAGSTTRASYYVDQTTGEITNFTPFASSSYVATARPWYVYGIASSGNSYAWVSPSGSATSTSVILSTVYVIISKYPEYNAAIL